MEISTDYTAVLLKKVLAVELHNRPFYSCVLSSPAFKQQLVWW